MLSLYDCNQAMMEVFRANGIGSEISPDMLDGQISVYTQKLESRSKDASEWVLVSINMPGQHSLTLEDCLLLSDLDDENAEGTLAWFRKTAEYCVNGHIREHPIEGLSYV